MNASLVAGRDPGAALAGPVPGFAQVLLPPGTTVQPCDFSRLAAALSLYGYGLFSAFAGVYGDVGTEGIGPYARPPAPWKKALM